MRDGELGRPYVDHLGFLCASLGGENFDGRSFLGVFDDEEPSGWGEIYPSHTFHEIAMHYPMRVVCTRSHKLIWNIAHGLSYPFALDLWARPTWQATYKRGPDGLYGKRAVKAFVERPAFELYDLDADPAEVDNLARDPQREELLAELKRKL